MGIQSTGASTGGIIIRRFIALVVVFLAFWLVWLWLISPPTALPAVYAHTDCRKVIIRAPDGTTVAGAEDLALVRDRGAVLLSAHDRLSSQTNGGLYAVSPFALSGGGTVDADLVYTPSADGRVFRPHGIAVSESGDMLAVINRSAPNSAQIEIGPLTRDGWTLDTTIMGEHLCRANDLAFTTREAAELYVTIDRQECVTSLADMMPGAMTGRIQLIGRDVDAPAQKGLKFPNGLVIEPGTDVPILAETRAAQIRTGAKTPIPVPGGPDNLTLDQDGKVIAALHPSLVQLWFYLNDWRERAPSRIARIDVESGAVEVLFDDPEGTLFAGATAALTIHDMLIAGSVRDTGLLVCRKGGA